MKAHNRLREARLAAGYKSARKAAEAMGVPVATYSQRESGARRLTADDQDRYLAFFSSNPAKV